MKWLADESVEMPVVDALRAEGYFVVVGDATIRIRPLGLS